MERVVSSRQCASLATLTAVGICKTHRPVNDLYDTIVIGLDEGRMEERGPDERVCLGKSSGPPHYPDSTEVGCAMPPESGFELEKVPPTRRSSARVYCPIRSASANLCACPSNAETHN